MQVRADPRSPTASSWRSTRAEGGADAPAFLLVHGLASNARLWDGVAAGLVARGHAVATVDLRGHGRSSKPDGPYDVPTVADDVAALIAGLGLDRPVVAGQSWGGNVVLELAARHPEADPGHRLRGRRVARAEPARSPTGRRAGPRSPRRASLGRPLAEIEGYIRAAHPDWPESGIRGTLANFEVRPDGTVAPWLTYERHLADPARALGPPPLGALRRDRGPGAPGAGRADGEVEDARAERRRHGRGRGARDDPGARVRWFTGDHDIHAQRPDELAEVMHAATVDGFLG